MEGIGNLGARTPIRIPNHWAPNQQLTISWATRIRSKRFPPEKAVNSRGVTGYTLPETSTAHEDRLSQKETSFREGIKTSDFPFKHWYKEISKTSNSEVFQSWRYDTNPNNAENFQGLKSLKMTIHLHSVGEHENFQPTWCSIKGKSLICICVISFYL